MKQRLTTTAAPDEADNVCYDERIVQCVLYHVVAMVGRMLRHVAVLLLFLSLSSTLRLHGQAVVLPGVGPGIGLGGGYPSDAYYSALQLYRDGDLESALEAIDIASRSTRTDGNGKWIDSIPVMALRAECLWLLGDLVACQANTDEAIRIAVRNRGWLSQVQWESIGQAGGTIVANPPSLWPEAAALRRLPLPSKMQFMSGQILTEQSLQRGGVIETANLKSVDVIEILRSLATLSHRRRVLLGPLASDESLASELLEATKYPEGLPSGVAKSMLVALRGTEYFATAEDATVVERLAVSSMINGMVHPLTPILLVDGCWINSHGKDGGSLAPDAASQVLLMAQQAANAAAATGSFEWVGEALQIAVGCAGPDQLALVERSASMAAGALVRQSRLASLHCHLIAADAAISSGRADVAEGHLQLAMTLSSRRDLVCPRLQAYGAYLNARVSAARGGRIGDDPSAPISNSLKIMNDFVSNRRDRNRALVSMPWNFQLALIDAMIGRNMGNQSAVKVMKSFAAGADLSRWRRDPLDALASHYSDSLNLHTALLRLAMAQNNALGVLQGTDRVLAERFLNRTPLHGRTLQIRTLASNPDEQLSRFAKEAIAGGGPSIKALREAVMKDVAIPADGPVRAATTAPILESKVSELALSRIIAPAVCPPALADKDSAAVPSGTAILTYLVDGQQLIGTLTRDGETRAWTVPGTRRMPTMINQLLQEIGANKTRGARIPEDSKWLQSAADLKAALLPASSLWSEEGIQKLIIVPDGPLWYVPFDLFPIGELTSDPVDTPEPETASSLWSEKMSVAYSPTPGLALRHVNLATSGARLGLIAGPFFEPRDAEANARIVDEVLEPVENPLRATLADAPPTDRIGLDIGHLVIAAAITPNLAEPMFTTLISPVNSENSADYRHVLRSWLELPAGGPVTVSLPGYRTTAGSAKIGDGSELFFPLVTLRCSGVRDCLISRWATGGISSSILIAELANEAPHTSLAEATQRGIESLRQTPLTVSGEPLLGKPDEDAKDLTGGQPLFWSTYLTTGCVGLSPSES